MEKCRYCIIGQKDGSKLELECSSTLVIDSMFRFWCEDIQTRPATAYTLSVSISPIQCLVALF